MTFVSLSRLANRWLYPLLALLLTIPAVAPLTYPGAFQTHQGLVPVYNVMDLATHLGTGATWVPAFGRGWDLLRGDGLVPYASATFFQFLGLSSLNAYKLVYGLSFIVSAFGMFGLGLWLYRRAAAGLLAAIVYVYFPYHLAVVYTRGAFGEAVFWALLPFGLLAFARLRAGASPRPGDYVPTALAWALLALTVPGLALLAGLGAVLVAMAASARPRRPHANFGIGIGLLVGLAPAFLAALRNPDASSSYAFIPAFVYPFQFLTATWGNALPRGSFLDQFPFQLGIAALGFTLIALVLAWRAAKEGLRPRRVMLWSAVLAGILLLLMTPWVGPLWDLTGAARLVEYPFEALGFVGLLLSLVTASIPLSEQRFTQAPLLAVLVTIPLLATYPYLAPEFFDFSPVRPPLAVFNNNELALLDAKIVRPVGTLRHGAYVSLDLEWQALRQVNHDYTVFVHAVDDGGKTWGGEDSKPQGGTLPTINWSVGRVISDTHTIQIDLNGPPEGYHLQVGIYAPNGERATTETGATEVSIGGYGDK